MTTPTTTWFGAIWDHIPALDTIVRRGTGIYISAYELGGGRVASVRIMKNGVSQWRFIFEQSKNTPDSAARIVAAYLRDEGYANDDLFRYPWERP